MGVCSNKLAQETLTVALAVRESRVKEITIQIDRGLQRCAGLFVVRVGPTAHTPHAVTNFADFPTRLAEPSVIHPEVHLAAIELYSKGASDYDKDHSRKPLRRSL